MEELPPWTFDNVLGLRGGLVAGVAHLAISRPRPHARDAVLRQTTARELRPDEEDESVGVDGRFPQFSVPPEGHARFTEVSAPRAPSRGPGCRQGETSTLPDRRLGRPSRYTGRCLDSARASALGGNFLPGHLYRWHSLTSMKRMTRKPLEFLAWLVPVVATFHIFLTGARPWHQHQGFSSPMTRWIAVGWWRSSCGETPTWHWPVRRPMAKWRSRSSARNGRMSSSWTSGCPPRRARSDPPHQARVARHEGAGPHPPD